MGEQLVYHNTKIGAAKNEEVDDEVYLTFTDVDNEEIHLVPIKIDRIEQYFNLVRQTAAGQAIEIVGPGGMPR